MHCTLWSCPLNALLFLQVKTCCFIWFFFSSTWLIILLAGFSSYLISGGIYDGYRGTPDNYGFFSILPLDFGVSSSCCKIIRASRAILKPQNIEKLKLVFVTRCTPDKPWGEMHSVFSI